MLCDNQDGDGPDIELNQRQILCAVQSALNETF